MTKCSFKDCNQEVYDDSDKCILHCEKDDLLEKKIMNYFGGNKDIDNFWNTFNKKLKENIENNFLKFTLENIIFPSMSKDKKYIEVELQKIKYLELKNCTFLDFIDMSNFLLVQNLVINDCTFKENVLFEKRIFRGHFFFQSNEVFKNIKFFNMEFNGTCSFTNNKFKNELTFNNVRFNDIALFNNSEIEDLFFQNTFFRKEANFLDIKLSKVGSRETARIIKDSFEKQNNIIEANKYYALEMKEREKELEKDLKNCKNFFEWLVFKIHGISSNHSQDWLLALFWIISFTFLSVTIEKIFSSSLTSSDKGVLSLLVFSMIVASNIYLSNSKRVYYLISIFIHYCIYSIFTQDLLLKCFSKTLNPFSLMQTDDPINGLQLLYKIIIAYLIYQFIVSIRQNTRRK
ncbi:hypothetical protein AAHK07_08945 [Aliarcobacter cryaerophilus]|uniref:pentapeptide repeat-containing protein n=1 Tax=Aliarcobacter cryaerophilus TaxID=28198 RepID=UPI0031810B00